MASTEEKELRRELGEESVSGVGCHDEWHQHWAAKWERQHERHMRREAWRAARHAFRRGQIDAVLGIYYFGLHLWMAVFGDSATAMRLPSVIAMAAAAAVVSLIGRRLGGGVAGLASGLIFAVIPSVSRYAQEARPYAFATFFAALATLMFLRAMERPRWSNWIIYAVVLAAAGAAPADGGILQKLEANAEKLVRIRPLEDFAVNPIEMNLHIVGDAAMHKRLGQ